MKKNLFILIFHLCLLFSAEFIIAQSTNGNSTPSGRENWFPNRGNVGIGTRTPSETLEVLGNVRVSQSIFSNQLEVNELKSTALYVREDGTIGKNLFVLGNIGIGVSAPSERLDINGNLKVSNFMFGDGLNVREFRVSENGSVGQGLSIGQNLLVGGSLGIGVASPSEKLDILGNIKASHGLYSDLVNSGEGVFSRNLSVTQNFLVSGSTGLGVSSPSERLDVEGNIKTSGAVMSNSISSGSGLFTETIRANQNIITDGYLGVGIITPTEKLDVVGNAKVSGNLFSGSLSTGSGLFTGTIHTNTNLISDGAIGIGTISPVEKLEVVGNVKVSNGLYSGFVNSGEAMFAGNIKTQQNLLASGSVGIGTEMPTERLEVNGNIKSSGNLYAVDIEADNGHFNNLESKGSLTIQGNVGIGVSAPIEKLEVSGNIKSTQAIISKSAQIESNIVAGGMLTIGGNVGVGMAPDQNRLSVAGNIHTSEGLLSSTLNTGQGTFTGNVETSGHLFVAGNVGVGVTNPTQKLEVDGNIRSSKILAQGVSADDGHFKTLQTDDALLINGNVGIGVTNPTEKLEVAGNIKSTGTMLTSAGEVQNDLLIGNKLTVNGNVGIGSPVGADRLTVGGDTRVTGHLISNSLSTGEGKFSKGIRVSEKIIADGAVGIGIISPTEKLEVAGNIKSTGDVSAANIRATKGVFADLESSGNFLIKGNVGVGVTAPGERLEVSGNIKATAGILSETAEIGTIKTNTLLAGSSIGIGTASPTEAIDVVGNIKASNEVSALNLKAQNGYFDNLYSKGGTLSVTGNLGVGVSAPVEKLEVDGNIKSTGDVSAVTVRSTNGYFNNLISNGPLSVSGNVGLGVANPADKLEVAGNVRSTGEVSAVNIRATNGYFDNLESKGGTLSVTGNLGVGVGAPVEKLEVDGNIKSTGDVSAVTFRSTNGYFNNLISNGPLSVSGNVGLGVANPADKLEVAGNVRSTGEVSAVNMRATNGYFDNLESKGGTLSVTGNLGVGVGAPVEKLEVDGNIKSTGDVSAINVRGTNAYFDNLVTTGGALSIDQAGVSTSGNLSVTGNVGIGAPAGTSKLSVAGDVSVDGILTTDALTVKEQLNVLGALSLSGLAIGVTSPEATVHVNGNGKFEGELRVNKLIANSFELLAGNPDDAQQTSLSLGENLFVDGSVGIGSKKINGYKLSVDGKIRAGDDIKVYSSAQWSDFVFAEGYKLRSLEEVDAYIKAHGHLPEIPSEKEVKKEGVDLVAMDAKLLQKIEELTLYMIEMKKENDLLKKEIQSLKSDKK